jgi:hypothetical protein
MLTDELIVIPEVCLDVVRFEGLYLVSNKGRVWSLPRQGTRGGLMHPQLGKKGYWMVHLHKHNREYLVPVHKMVLEAFAGLRPEGMEACHGEGGKQDNRWPENLSWGTKSKNMGEDRVRDGTDNSGERNGSAKLSAVDVMVLRSLNLVDGDGNRDYTKSIASLARQFGVGWTAVYNAINGDTWRR